MVGHVIAYLVPMIACTLLGMGLGAVIGGDPFEAGGIGLVVGFFVGVGVYSWRTHDQPNSFEDRDLTGWTDD